jgi:AcrR family transcriptional regulator
MAERSRKERIAHAALKLFAKKGFHATGTRELSDYAEVSEALLFRHYKNKEGLLLAALETMETERKRIFRPLAGQGPEALEKHLALLERSIKRHKSYWRLRLQLQCDEQLADVIKPMEEEEWEKYMTWYAERSGRKRKPSTTEVHFFQVQVRGLYAFLILTKEEAPFDIKGLIKRIK